AVERAPEAATLRQMTPERIYSALTSGSMRVQAEGLPDETKRGIAEFLSDRKLSSGEVADARMMSNRCPSGPSAFNASNGPSWNGWGVTPINTRFQPAEAAGLSRDQFKGLKVKWAFGVPGAAAVYGQPSLVGGRLFFGADTGYVYSLDAASGCVYWSFQAQ